MVGIIRAVRVRRGVEVEGLVWLVDVELELECGPSEVGGLWASGPSEAVGEVSVVGVVVVDDDMLVLGDRMSVLELCIG